MRTGITRRTTPENSDAVGFIIALLVRFPEIATLVSHPTDGTLRLSFAVRSRLDRGAERALRESIGDHVRSYAELYKETIDALAVELEADQALTFVHVTRDARTFTREELSMLVALLANRFGDALVRNPVEEDAFDDDPAAADEMVEYALDALRDPAEQKSLVGFREEKRVLVYFVKTRKKPKARARS